jgi:hypothetical protein
VFFGHPLIGVIALPFLNMATPVASPPFVNQCFGYLVKEIVKKYFWGRSHSDGTRGHATCLASRHCLIIILIIYLFRPAALDVTYDSKIANKIEG